MLVLATTLCWTSVLAAPLAEPINHENNSLVRRSEGWWQVENRCSDTIYYTSVDEVGTVVGNGYVEPGTTTLGDYGSNKNGLSVKMCWTSGCSDPYQFETTVDDATGLVSYDLSAVDGNPFINVANGVYPSDGSGPTYWCVAGDESCAFRTTDSGPVGSALTSAVIIAQFCY